MKLLYLLKYNRVMFIVIATTIVATAIVAASYFPNQEICINGLCGKNTARYNKSAFAEMGDFFLNLTSTANWPARWSCGDWSGFQGWASIFSDTLIFISYMGIPLVILYFISKRKGEEIPLPNILKLFSFFILACGFTHFIDTILFWQPIYNISILVKLLTAAISFTTLVALFNIFPQLMLYKSPAALQKVVNERTETLAITNKQLLNEVEIRQKTEDDLKHSLALNDVMFKEIHHRIKNNLQSISSILYLTSHSMSNESKNALKTVNDRIKGISYVHEMLLRSKSLSSINFNNYVRDLLKHLPKSNADSKEVEINLQVDDAIVVSSDIATNCGLIISECFINSEKHAVTDGPLKFNIQAMVNQDNKVELVIEDNGKGFDQVQVSTRLTPQFGLSLIETFVKAIHGTMEINSIGKTQFKITFPIE